MNESKLVEVITVSTALFDSSFWLAQNAYGTRGRTVDYHDHNDMV